MTDQIDKMLSDLDAGMRARDAAYAAGAGQRAAMEAVLATGPCACLLCGAMGPNMAWGVEHSKACHLRPIKDGHICTPQRVRWPVVVAWLCMGAFAGVVWALAIFGAIHLGG